MKLFGLLRKPDWEHKDAAIRLQAVRSSNDPILLGLLPELCQRDPEPGVRAAALRRIDDLALLARRLRGEHEAAVAQAARERLQERLCARDLPLDFRLAAFAEVLDADLITRIAEHAPESALRRAALEQINRPGLLFERCLNDPDASIRRWLLTRIDSPEALQRLAEGSRKRDKSLSRAARERLEAMQLASGDPKAIAQRALQLCEQVERLGRELPADREERLAAIRQELATLDPRLTPEMQRRVKGYIELAEAAFAGARGEPAAVLPPAPSAEPEASTPEQVPTAPKPEPDPELAQLIDRLKAATSPSAVDLDQLQTQARQRAASIDATSATALQLRQIEEAVGELRSQQKAEREAEANRQKEAQAEALNRLEAALKSGNLAEARTLRSELEAMPLARELKRRLATADEGIEKLARWQRWSGNKVRGRLCDEAEALHGSGLHPDAVASRIKELQAEWARLDSIEGEAAPAAESGLARRFRGLCHRAIAPARPYFEKRRELRSERAGQIDTLLQELDAALPGSDGKALAQLRRRVVEAMRELADVDPSKRTSQGRALRERLAAIDAAMDASREEAALAKRKLIARLKRELGGHVETGAAIALARQAQDDWKRLPRAERSVEDALWNELRALVDPLFERQREAEGESRQRDAEAEAAARAVLDELDALAAADDDRLAHAEAHLDALAARWRALPVSQPEPSERGAGSRTGRDPRRGGKAEDRRPPSRRAHPQEPRFDAAVAKVQAARAQAAARREHQALQTICEAGALLDRIASAPDQAAAAEARASFDSLTLPGDVRLLLQARLDGSATAAQPEQARSLAVRAELAAGLDSPTEDADIRRREQRQRLASKLGGEPLPPAAQEIRSLLVALQALAGLPQGEREALQRRILAAFERPRG